MSGGFSREALVEDDVLPVRPQGRWLQFVAARTADQRILPSWTATIRDASNAVKSDAVELAEMAFKKWRAAARDGSVAYSLQDWNASSRRTSTARLQFCSSPGRHG